MVLYNYSLAVVALASHIFIYIEFHLAVGLVSCHMPEDGWADSAFGPFFLADELNQASFVIDVRAA